MITASTTLRELARQPKRVVESVKRTKQPKVIVRKSEPQAVIISLEDYSRLERSKSKQTSLKLLKLALSQREELKDLPADLRQKADQILYSR